MTWFTFHHVCMAEKLIFSFKQFVPEIKFKAGSWFVRTDECIFAEIDPRQVKLSLRKLASSQNNPSWKRMY